MLLSAVSVLIVAQSSSEIPEGLMNNPVLSEQSRRADKGLFSSFGFGRGANNPHGKNWSSYGTVIIGSGMYRSFGTI